MVHKHGYPVFKQKLWIFNIMHHMVLYVNNSFIDHILSQHSIFLYKILTIGLSLNFDNWSSWNYLDFLKGKRQLLLIKLQLLSDIPKLPSVSCKLCCVTTSDFIPYQLWLPSEIFLIFKYFWIFDSSALSHFPS